MSDNPAVLYTEFVTKEIRPLLKSKDYGERKIGFVRAALLHSWMDFMKDMNSRELALLEAGFELVIEEGENWKSLEKAIPDVHRGTFDNTMNAIILLFNSMQDPAKLRTWVNN